MRAIWVVAVLALAACSARGETGDVDDDDGGLSATVGDWSANLAARNNSGITGDASVHSAVAASQVSIRIRGASAGAVHPWHVHHGTCGSGGAIVDEAGDYPALTVGTGGGASATATIEVALEDDHAYHVNVHRSPQDLGTIVACGNLDN